jgi:peptidyl-tRNA hydrolase
MVMQDRKWSKKWFEEMLAKKVYKMKTKVQFTLLSDQANTVGLVQSRIAWYL